MAATGSYITQTDVEKRLTAAFIRQVYDDDADGTLEAGEEPALTDIILDAEELVESTIRKTYGGAGFDWLRAIGTGAPRSIKRRCLDAVRILIAERHPGYIRIDTEQAWKRFYADLASLRSREIEMAVAGGADPEPAVNEGGDVYSGDPDDTTPKAKVFLDSTGIFLLL